MSEKLNKTLLWVTSMALMADLMAVMYMMISNTQAFHFSHLCTYSIIFLPRGKEKDALPRESVFFSRAYASAAVMMAIL